MMVRSKRASFVVITLLLAATIAAAAGLAAPTLGVGLGVTLLIAGIIVGGIGASLAVPDPQDYHNPRNRVLLYINRLFFDHPNEFAADQMAYDREHSAPLWDFEDVMVWAGFVDIVFGIVLIVLRK